MTKRISFKIPDNATLPEVIEIMNFMNLGCSPDDNDPEFQKWIYDHQDWVIVDGK